MALIIKTGKFEFAKKLGVDDSLLAGLSHLGIKMGLGVNDFSFYSSKNIKLGGGVLPCSAQALSKDTASAFDKKLARLAIQNEAAKLLEQHGIKNQASLDSALIEEKVTQQLQKTDELLEAALGPHSAAPKNGLVPLRAASALYQQVTGTSPGSVYVVVALSDSVKVAAKASLGSLAIRVEAEGGIPKPARAAFESLGFEFKKNKTGEYMSVHFQCANVTPARVLGAVLLGSGVEFNTPLPSIHKVISLSVLK